MNVVYSLTRNLYPYLEGAIASLLEHNKAKVYVIAEDDELPFPNSCEVINMRDQEYFKASCPNLSNRFSYMAMLRVCTADIIPEDKVIQLDIDTIVCDSLGPIWNVDLTGKWIAWVPEHQGHWDPYGRAYYNFGVAVLNLEQMRRDKASSMLVNELNTKVYPFIDQDVMNLFAVPHKSVELPVRYNECFCCGFTDDPAIVHYAGEPLWYQEKVPRWEYRAKYERVL